MGNGFSNQPKILRGAFVEFGLSLPPLFVVFQFNPVLITRTRTATVGGSTAPSAQACEAARQQVAQNISLVQQVKRRPGSLFTDLRAGQSITVKQESITFDVRLDATDKLNEGDGITEQFGIAPQLSTLELMMVPKSQSVLGGLATLLTGPQGGFAFFSEDQNPPIILFIWGRKKVLPVNITNMQIKEEEFSTDLNPTRAVVSVTLEVIEGPSLPFLYSKTLKEVMSALNLANIADLANTIVPQRS